MSRKRLTLLVSMSLLVIAVALAAVLPVFANHALDGGVSVKCLNGTVFFNVHAGYSEHDYVETYVENLETGSSNTTIRNASFFPAYTVTDTTGDLTIGDQVYWYIEVDGPGNSPNATREGVVTCTYGQGELDPPTAIWLAHVCEPLDGFSADGWTTVDSDANSKPWGTTLYVAPSADGPWSATEFLQPPYVISQSQMDALAAWMGVASRNDLSMRAGEVGTPANYGSMVTDREAIMDSLCGN